ncbi:MAG: lipid A-modifier LpxR family protein [Pseudomonadota bacterium]
MLRYFALAGAAALTAIAPVKAQSPLMASDREPSNVAQSTANPFDGPSRRVRLGYGRLITNDLFGDGQDRWRTGSITSSRVWGYDWSGVPPSQFGELLEFRLSAQILQPDDLKRLDTDDRPWAGTLAFGLHTHASYGQLEYAVGVDVNVIGPQTNLDGFQAWFHRLIDAPEPSDEVLNAQIGNAVRPTLVAEIGQNLTFGDVTQVRPFAELRAGDETMVRIGADVTFGAFGLGDLMAREVTTGHRYRVIRDPNAGFSFLVGGDVAYVADSVYLPEDRGYELTDSRNRLRAGLHWQGDGLSAFYGLTYLGKEFEAQEEGQIVGSLRVEYQF